MTTDTPNPAPPAGLVAGKYECVWRNAAGAYEHRLIGRGGMGAVWEGRHASLGTRVAIKFIDSEYANSQDARQRFIVEARAAATIQSKHAIQIFDHGVTEEGRPYIVMELLVGEPLDNRLKRLGRLSLADTARIIQQVCRALHRAHESGIIHRDLKPENIFLVNHPDDDDEIAKVLDFGIAKIKTAPGAMGVSSATKTGTLLGTPFYMSPEQARGLRNVDHRSDLWALGVIVYRCITGVLPFDGESLGDLLVKLCTAPIPLPSRAAPDISPQLDGWIVRALDREPEMRFQSAHELSDSLSFVAGVSVKRGVGSSLTPTGLSAYVPSSRPDSAPVTPAMYAPTEAEQPIPAATSAPFTTAPRAAKSSRGLLLGLVLLFGGVGFAGGAVILTRVLRNDAPPLLTTAATSPPPPAEPLPSATVALPPASATAPPAPSADTAASARPKAETKPTKPGPTRPATATTSRPVTPPSTPAPTVVAPPQPPTPKLTNQTGY